MYNYQVYRDAWCVIFQIMRRHEDIRYKCTTYQTTRCRISEELRILTHYNCSALGQSNIGQWDILMLHFYVNQGVNLPPLFMFTRVEISDAVFVRVYVNHYVCVRTLAWHENFQASRDSVSHKDLCSGHDENRYWLRDLKLPSRSRRKLCSSWLLHGEYW